MIAARQPTPSPLHALLSQTFAGDASAARALAETLLLPTIEAAVSKYLFGRARQFFEKDDLVQEVFEHLCKNQWQKLRLYDPSRGTLENFLFEVSRSFVRDNSRRRPPPDPSDDLTEHSAPSGDPEDALQVSRAMERVLAALDDDELLLFRWVYLEGLGRPELASRTQLSLEAIYKRVQRMEAKVKVALSNSEKPLRTPKGAHP